MKVMIGIVLVASLVLTGCMTTPEIKRVEANLAAAQIEVDAGRMKLSEYWTLYYNQTLTMSWIAAKGATLKGANDMIDASLAYESGKITKAEYDSRFRNAGAYITEAKEGETRAARGSSRASNNRTKRCYSQKIGWTVTTTCN